MRSLAEKLVLIETEIARERGDFSLFALVEREEVPGAWDLVISAGWMVEDPRPPLEYVASKLRAKLEPSQLASLARIVPLETTHEFVRNLNLVNVQHGLLEIVDCILGGMRVGHAYVITSLSGEATSDQRTKGAGGAKPLTPTVLYHVVTPG
jgi:hypothetical protein